MLGTQARHRINWHRHRVELNQQTLQIVRANGGSVALDSEVELKQEMKDEEIAVHSARRGRRAWTQRNRTMRRQTQ